ncbi:MAG: hypothetical protein AM1032_000147 [Mycoplasmataceae bacterium]|nr:MAG: hypothetical protein AM1032_000147 [Mycoplasmataceae bacterium]
MLTLNNNQFSSLLENLKRIEKGFINQEKQFEIINKKFESLNEKIDKQDKSKWINNILEPFSFAFIYRSISFYFSKNISADSIKNINSYFNKEKVKFEISKLLLIWIILTIIRESYSYFKKRNREEKSFKWLNYLLKIILNKSLILKQLMNNNYQKSLINLPIEINNSRNELTLLNA